MKDDTTLMRIYKAKPIGLFLLLAFFAYGFGRNLFEKTDSTEQYIGALLIISNSIMVFLIGFWLRKTLQKYNELVGNLYFIVRVFEAIALASIVVNLIPGIPISNELGYRLAMFVLGLGSIPMCVLLYKYKITPNWLAIWGIVGYSIFSFGFLMELFGKSWSMYLLGLGALWEITFALWLIIKGGKEDVMTS